MKHKLSFYLTYLLFSLHVLTSSQLFSSELADKNSQILSENFTINISAPEMSKSLTYHQMFFNSFVTDDKTIKKTFLNDYFLAIENLKRSQDSKEEIETQIKMLFIKYFSDSEKNDILQDAKSRISEDIVKSYYISHQNEFVMPEKYDLYVLQSESPNNLKMLLKQIEKEKNILWSLKQKEHQHFRKISIHQIPLAWKFHLESLSSHTFSEIFKFQNDFYSLLYTNKYPEAKIPFKNMQNEIRELLVKKKFDEILSKRLLGQHE